jgi:phosphoglycolate phosphatase
MDLKKFFNVVVGARDNIPLKPQPDMLHLAMRQFNTTKTCFLMVGDTINDIASAKAANIESVAIAGGYTDVDVKTLKADYTLDNMRDIISLFK